MFFTIVGTLQKKIEKNFENVKIIQNDWEELKVKDTYLTQSERYKFSTSLEKISTYTFNKFKEIIFIALISLQHGKMFYSCKKIVNKLNLEISNYNDRFIQKRLKDYKSFFYGIDDNLKIPLDEDQR